MSSLQINILLLLRAAGVYGGNVDDLITDLRRGSHRGVSLPEVENALRSLADESLVHSYDTSLRARKWRISGVGIAALKEEGL